MEIVNLPMGYARTTATIAQEAINPECVAGLRRVNAARPIQPEEVNFEGLFNSTRIRLYTFI